MEYRLFLSFVLICTLFSLDASAETTTLHGLPFFDTSLGVLHKATVTIDPVERDLASYYSSAQPISSHQHFVTNPPFQLGPREVVFPPVPTSFESAPALVFHGHHYDPPPVVVVFEGADLSYFIFNGTFIHPGGFFLPGGVTTEAEGHSHYVGDYSIGGINEFTTTFEYTPVAVPEPSAAGLISMSLAAILTLLRRQSSNRHL